MRVVIVDDNPTNLVLMAALAKAVSGEDAITYEDPVRGLQSCLTDPADLVVVDFMMPELDGIEFIERLRMDPKGHDVPVVMVTAADQKSVRRRALEAGATDFINKPIDTVEMKLRLTNLLQLRQARNLLQDQAALLAEEVRAATQAMREGELELVTRLAQAAEFRDPETGGHIQRMAHYSVLIGRQLGMDPAYLYNLLTAAPLHDIGKVGIPDSILLKPGRLDEGEFVVMRGHAAIGEQLLADSSVPLIRMACEIAGNHHEKFDGTGYPRGVSGEAIPLSARIVAVADVLDALTSVRPYKSAWTMDAARDYILEGRGKHFCPRCVDALFAGWDEVLAIKQEFPD